MFPTIVWLLMMGVVLFPFEKRIIYDSLLIPYQVSFRGGAKKVSWESIINQRQSRNYYHIIKQLSLHWTIGTQIPHITNV